VIPVNEPLITDEAKKYVAEVMASGWISSAGPAVERFERSFADFLGVKHAVTTTSGTTALHLALAALGIGPGDEVIVPDFTMIATVCAVLYTGAAAVFVDSEPDTYTLDASLVGKAITRRTKAIVPVHIFGHSADMDPIRALADAHGLWVVEDAAEAHGATYKQRLCGSLGHLAAFSFYANKIVTTGEGGMVVTDDGALAARARLLRDMAHRPGQRFRHDELGYNYRMTSLQAACGLGQLEHIDAFVERKRRMAVDYGRRLHGIDGLRLPVTRPWAGNVHWMYAVLLEDRFPWSRDVFRAKLAQRGVDTRDFFPSSASQPMVRKQGPAQGPFPIAEAIAARGLCLPSGLALTNEQLDFVCDAIDDIVR
jgi:perosamine synthetase